eukprot:266552-Prymnesium_polylepis.1
MHARRTVPCARECSHRAARPAELRAQAVSTILCNNLVADASMVPLVATLSALHVALKKRCRSLARPPRPHPTVVSNSKFTPRLL